MIGTGYVGLTTGACLASLGHSVVCADADPHKVERLREARVDILEPGLPETVRDALDAALLDFTGDTAAAVAEAGVVFLCLPTPMGAGGAADLAAVEAVAAQIREELPPGCVVVNKSTVPVGTSERVATLLGRDDVAVVSNPEFLREGRAVHDFLHPDRIVIGAADRDAARRVADLYAGLDAPLVLTDPASAELTKYAANFFLAMKLSFANNLATVCERLSLAMTIVADITTPRERGRYQGYFMAVFGGASIVGPLVGGAFADRAELLGIAGWRWIFLINVPLAAAAAVAITRVLRFPHRRAPSPVGRRRMG
ncbi:nucleotide sugar dehydrogenase [Streptomyces sp. NPDC006129]|uniref:nucleotide sugar dehydrogenase n=1 Tax=Streptomyces sp. NPDC006129 TaxID=3155348 RepID=UPI0033A82A95